MRKQFLKKAMSALLAGALTASMIPVFAANAASSGYITNDANGIYNKNLYMDVLAHYDANKDGKLSASEASKVTDINIVNQKVTSLKGIHHLPNLKSLTIQNCALSSVHSDLGKLSKLEELNLSYNKISALPSSVYGLKNLESVDLSGNKLASLTSSAKYWTKVTELDLSNNAFSTFPSVIGYMKALEKLDVSHNKIVNNTTTTKKYTYYLKYLTNLTELDLSYNSLTSFPGYSFKYNRKLQKLDLSHNKLASVLKDIGYLRYLKEFDISDNQVKSVSSYIKNCSRLTKLDLSNNKLTNSSMPNLTSMKYLKCTGSDYYALNLCGNRLSYSTIRKYTNNKALSSAWAKRQTTKTFVSITSIEPKQDVVVAKFGESVNMSSQFKVNPSNATYRTYKYEVVNASKGIKASMSGSTLTTEKTDQNISAGYVFVKVISLDGSNVNGVIMVQIV